MHDASEKPTVRRLPAPPDSLVFAPTGDISELSSITDLHPYGSLAVPKILPGALCPLFILVRQSSYGPVCLAGCLGRIRDLSVLVQMSSRLVGLRSSKV